MPRKKLPQSSKIQLANLCNNLASAWFIAGFVTPIFTNDILTPSLFYRAIVSPLAGIFFTKLSTSYAGS